MGKIEYKSFLKKPAGKNETDKCKYLMRLDTYGCGCSHNCGYCYARSLLDFRGLWKPDNPAVADIEKIKKKIAKIPAGTVLRLGGMTDCFQDLEKTERVTYETIKLLNDKKIHYLIVTKSDLVASDEYMEILDKDLAHVQISVTSTDDKIAARYENAPSVTSRIKAVEKLYKNGFDVQLRLSPYIPEFVDLSVINDIECDKILIEFLRVNSFIKKTFKEVDYSRYTHKQSGYCHLELEDKIKAIEGIKKKYISVCEDVDEHYVYWNKNANVNPKDCCNLRIEEK